MSAIKVSVIIPIFNSSKFLKDALNGIVNQTLEEIEIICVDDGSSDGSDDILQEFASKDSRVKILYQENKGAGAARNTGLAAAKGTYLSFVDSDDLFEPDMLEKACAVADASEVDFVIFGADAFSNITGRKMSSDFILHTEQLPAKEVFSIKDMPDRIFTFSFNVAWNKLYRRSFIMNSRIGFQEIYSNNDCFFACATLASATKICCIKDVLLHYRREITDQLSQFNEISLSDWNMLSAFEKIHAFIDKREFYADVIENFAEYTISNLIGRLNRSKSKDDPEVRALVTEYWIPKLGIGRTNFRHNADYIKYHSFLDSEFTKSFFLNPKLMTKPMYVPPYIPNLFESRIVLYGAGTVGLDIYLQLERVALWVDVNAVELSKKGYPVQEPSQILNIDFDYVLVSIAQSDLSHEARGQLIELGIPENKIVGAWGRRFY